MTGMLGSMLERLEASSVPGALVSALGPAVIGTLLDRLNQVGFGAQVNSWLGQGANQPITADELRRALGSQQVQDLAKEHGIPADKLIEILSQHLPAAASQAKAAPQ